MFIIKKKTAIIVLTYAAAAIAALSALLVVGNLRLRDYRLATGYSSRQAFEETVTAVNSLNEGLKKSLYATDAGMCSAICASAYADALSAEAAMSTLPFETAELERISAYLNVTGDYAYSLFIAGFSDGFGDEQVKTLTQLSEQALELSGTLTELQGHLNDSLVSMDSRELKLRNVGEEPKSEKVSERLLSYDRGLSAQELSYDGKYTGETDSHSGELDSAQMLSVAADYAGVKPEKLKTEYEYADGSGRQCYSIGDMLICVSPRGIESMSQSRLVSESRLSAEKAAEAAKRFLQGHGFGDTELIKTVSNGAVMSMSFAVKDGEVLRLDSVLTVSIAMDNGSVYNFSAENYKAQPESVKWKIEAEQAQQALPESLSLADTRKVVLASPGGRAVACYELSCEDANSTPVKIYVNAESGEQYDIVL